PPSRTSSWVSAGFSTPTPSSFGSNETWVTQLMVMRLRRSPARLPRTYRPYGSVHSTRRRSLSYSSCATGSSPTDGGNGPIAPAPPGTPMAGDPTRVPVADPVAAPGSVLLEV